MPRPFSCLFFFGVPVNVSQIFLSFFPSRSWLVVLFGIFPRLCFPVPDSGFSIMTVLLFVSYLAEFLSEAHFLEVLLFLLSAEIHDGPP